MDSNARPMVSGSGARAGLPALKEKTGAGVSRISRRLATLILSLP